MTGKKIAKIKTLKEDDFEGFQLDLFRSFLCNNEDERSELSNVFDLWDSVPRYAISRQRMDKIRKEKGFLDLMTVDFHYRQKPVKVTIQAARVLDKKTGETTDYYPSGNEELVEDALRKIAAEQRNGFYDKEQRAGGVTFSLYMLREELRKRGHSRTYTELILSLEILSGSVIRIEGEGIEGEAVKKSTYFRDLTAVSRKRLSEDPDSRWVVYFHPLVTRDLDALRYRQFNYAQMMSYRTQLARWLHKHLSMKFTYASLVSPFTIRYSTIARDSRMLDGYKREVKAIEALDGAMDELVQAGVLAQFKKELSLGKRNKIEDVVYTLHASADFTKEMKAANLREKLAEQKFAGASPHQAARGDSGSIGGGSGVRRTAQIDDLRSSLKAKG
jgi:hypothetical protein